MISSCALQLTALTVAGAFAASPARAATAPESSDAPADEVRTPSSYETSGPKTAPEQDIKTPPDYEPTRTTGVMAGDIKDPGPLDGTAGPGSVELPPQPTASVDHERVVSSRREPIPPAVPPPTQPTRPTAGDHDADEDRARQDRHRGIAAVAVGGAVAITGFALTGYYGVALKKAGDDLTEAELQHETFDCSAPGSNLRQECRRAQDHLDAARRQRHRSSDAVVATAIVGSLGVAILLVGTIRYATAVQREAREDRAWIRVRPALGGLLVQGRF